MLASIFTYNLGILYLEDLLQKIEKGTVPESRVDDAKLSANLAAMRAAWDQGRRQGKMAKKYAVDEAQRTNELTLADRCLRREQENRSVSKSTARDSRESWRDRMAKREKESVQQNRARDAY